MTARSSVVRRLALAGAVAGMPLAGLLTFTHPAGADSPTDTVVEASQDFCVHPDQGCTQPSQLGNLGYEEVAAVNTSGQSFATPDHVVFVCARGYTAADRTPHALAGHAFVGNAPGFDGGTVRGKMFLLGRPTEANTFAVSAVNVEGHDPVMQTWARAVGWQVTNNVTDQPRFSDIDVTISGQLTDETPSGPAGTVWGTISCDIHASAAVIGAPPLGQPPDSEAVMADTDSD